MSKARLRVLANLVTTRQGAIRAGGVGGWRKFASEKSLRKFSTGATFSGVAGHHPSPTSGDDPSRGPNLPSPTSGGSVRTFDGAALYGPPRRLWGAALSLLRGPQRVHQVPRQRRAHVDRLSRDRVRERQPASVQELPG